MAATAVSATTLAYWLMGTDGQAEPSLLSSYRALVTYSPASKTNGRSAIPDLPTLAAAVHWAETSLGDVRRIRDYTCTLIKRKRWGEQLIGPQYMTVKVRQEPYSVYARTPRRMHCATRRQFTLRDATTASCWLIPTAYAIGWWARLP